MAGFGHMRPLCIDGSLHNDRIDWLALLGGGSYHYGVSGWWLDGYNVCVIGCDSNITEQSRSHRKHTE